MPALLSWKQSNRASNSEIGPVKSLHDVRRLQVGQPKVRLKGTCDIPEEGPHRRSVETVAFSAITSARQTCAERFDCRFAITLPLCDRRINSPVVVHLAKNDILGVNLAAVFAWFETERSHRRCKNARQNTARPNRLSSRTRRHSCSIRLLPRCVAPTAPRRSGNSGGS